MKKLRDSLLPLLLLGWVLIVITAYFVVQKPWPNFGALAALGAAADLLVAGAVLAASGGLGQRFLGRLKGLQPFEAAALQLGVGLGVISLGILLLGVFGLISRLSSWIVLIALAAWLHRPILAWVRLINEGLNQGWPAQVTARVAGVVCLFLGAVSLLQAMAPPLKWDSLVYHLALPQQYLMTGQTRFISGNLFTGFPQLAEMNYTFAMALRSGPCAALLGWGAGMMAVLGLAGFAKRVLGQTAFWLAPAVLLAGASLWQGLAWAYVDHWVLLYGLLLFISLERYGSSRRPMWLWLAGAAIGFAASSKYTGALLGLAGLVWLSLMHLEPASKSQKSQRPGGSQSSRNPVERRLLVIEGLKLAGIALLVFAPWLVKNWLTGGNPVYPFIWPGLEIDALRQTFHSQGESAISLLGVPILPWLVTVLGVEGGAGFSSSIGPLYLALIPGLLLGIGGFEAESARVLRKAGVIAILVWLLWGLGGLLADPLSRSRHYYGFFPILALLAAAGYQRLKGLVVGQVRIGWVISRLVLFAFVLVGLDGAFQLAQNNPLPAALGQQSEPEYLADQLGWYGPVMAALDELPAEAKIEMLWEARSYYCPRSCRPDVILDKWWYWQRTLADGQAIAQYLKNQGVSHVLIYDFGAEFERRHRELQDPADWRALDQFRSQQLSLVQRFGDGYSLYAWPDSE